MLEKIKLQNFKLHKDTTLEIKPITIFIGQNNSGKSSIFQALQLIKQNPDQDYYLNPNLLIDIGTFEDVLRNDGRFIGISLDGNVPAKNRVKIPVEN